jgi:hypothetical protein
VLTSLLHAFLISAMFTRVSSDIVIVPIFDHKGLRIIRQLFDDNVKTFREFHHPSEGSGVKYPYVLGSFGAFRNASAFHCPFARSVRDTVHEPAKAAISEQGKYFTQLWDSMSLRYAGSEYKGESWHRDSHPKAGKIYGGWVNLDDEPQHFRCVPDSASKTGQGFGSEQIPPEYLQRTIEIPPGSMILFRQDVLHCILKSKKTFDSYRMYVGFRISDSPDTIYDTIEIITEQSVPPLPSGEKAAMFSRNHDSALLYSHTFPWSECIVQDWIKETRMIGGVQFVMCPRQMTKGLTWYGRAYQPYTVQERVIMTPHLV